MFRPARPAICHVQLLSQSGKDALKGNDGRGDTPGVATGPVPSPVLSPVVMLCPTGSADCASASSAIGQPSRVVPHAVIRGRRRDNSGQITRLRGSLSPARPPRPNNQKVVRLTGAFFDRHQPGIAPNRRVSLSGRLRSLSIGRADVLPDRQLGPLPAGGGPFCLSAGAHLRILGNSFPPPLEQGNPGPQRAFLACESLTRSARGVLRDALSTCLWL